MRRVLVLAHETGHHTGATRQLRWSDIRPDAPDNPVAGQSREDRGRARDAHPFEHLSRSLARDWWKKAEKLARLEPKWGRGRPSLRRRFASDLMDLPLGSVHCFAMCRTVLFIRVW